MRTLYVVIKAIIVLFMLIDPIKAASDGTTSPFDTDPADHDFSTNPDLLKRILATPHGYFRFINIQFSNYMCEYFSDILVGQPSLNLHGDAHLEQYAVTDLGRGLTDFDDSATGPALLDWMRFGVSLHLACHQLGWEDVSDSMFVTFLHAYKSALTNPEKTAKEPSIVKAIKSNFTHDRVKYFAWVNSIMKPMPQSQQDSLLEAMQPYIQTQFAEDTDIPANYFNVHSMGYLQMGIGSALDIKFIVRVRGQTDDPMDDLVLEIKQVRDLSGIACIQTGQKTDPFRILLGQSRIAYHPFHHLGYFQFRGMTFWVHSWVDNYKELKIESSFKTQEDLFQVVYDIGVQLGRGHIKHIAAPLDVQVCRSQIHLLENNQTRLQKQCHIFARQIEDAWKLFCEQAK